MQDFAELKGRSFLDCLSSQDSDVDATVSRAMNFFPLAMIALLTVEEHPSKGVQP